MKTTIIYLIVIGAIIFGLYYYFVLLPKKPQTSTTEENAPSVNPKSPSIEDLKAKGYNADEIALIVESDAYKNGTGNW